MFLRANISIKDVIFLVMGLILVYFMFQIKEIMLLFFAGFVLAASLNPLIDKLSRYVRREIAAVVVFLVSIAIVLLFFVPLITLSIKEISIFADGLPQKIHDADIFLRNKVIFGHKLVEFINFDMVLENASKIGSHIFSQSINITMALLDGITVILAVMMVFFYFVYDKSPFSDYFLRLFPPKNKQRAKKIASEITARVGGYVIAQGISMLIVGVFTALGLLILKVKFALLLGLLAGLLDIIPIVGPTIALLMGILAVYHKGWGMVALVIAIYLIAQWISNSLARPLVFAKFMNIHPLVIIFAFLVCAKFLGVWGVILAPAIVSVLATLFDELYIKVINGET